MNYQRGSGYWRQRAQDLYKENSELRLEIVRLHRKAMRHLCIDILIWVGVLTVILTVTK